MNIDYGTKLYEAFPNLQGIEREIWDLELPVRVFNTLKRNNIDTLQDVLKYSCNELMQLKGSRQQHITDVVNYILFILDNFNEHES
jgi:DNA-directed RNA polymerase alpha subunit